MIDRDEVARNADRAMKEIRERCHGLDLEKAIFEAWCIGYEAGRNHEGRQWREMISRRVEEIERRRTL